MIARMHRPLEGTVRRSRPGFTLMEILIVVAIIVILASVGGFYVMGQYKEAQVNEARFKAKSISDAISVYEVDHGVPPTDITSLLVKTESGKGPYLKNQTDIIDPWGKQFQYDPSGQRNAKYGAVVTIPDVYTTTPDGREVGNWRAK